MQKLVKATRPVEEVMETLETVQENILDGNFFYVVHTWEGHGDYVALYSKGETNKIKSIIFECPNDIRTRIGCGSGLPSEYGTIIEDTDYPGEIVKFDKFHEAVQYCTLQSGG